MIQGRFRTFAGIEHGQCHMTFEEYLVKKRINKEAFAAEDPDRYRSWESMYAQMHPNSFYVAVKMVLNNVRLRFHLHEEDVPKPATTAVPRPAARRAAAPVAKPEPESPAAIPATPDVSQETAEEKPVMTAAAPKPRPVVRRPAALKTPPAEGDTAAPVKPAEEAAEPSAPRARPVIKRPAALSKAKEQPANQEQENGAIPEQPAAAADAPAEPAKPARPRPVIKRPAALQKPSQEEEKPVGEAPSESIAPTSNATAASDAPKPPRPRPVIKRPTALQKPVEEQPAPEVGDKPATAETAPAGTGSPAQSAAEGTAKAPRPRPVIKRPAALTKPAAPEVTPNEAKPADAAATEPQAGESPTGGDITEAKPAAEQSAKPPRPRPIIRRPAPPAAAQEAEPSGNPEAEEQQQPAGQPQNTPAADIPAGATGGSAIPEEEAPKPPRPRPIMRRPPPKTEE